MGCDIHVFVERKKNDKWVHYTGKHFSLSAWEKEYSKTEKCNAPFDWRSYGMYGFLAGVRARDIKPIKDPACKIPDDASEFVKKEYERWDGDGHSHSSLTAKELLEFDYNQDLRSPDEDFSTNSRGVLFEKKICPKHRDFDEEDNYKTYFDYLGGPDGMFFTHVNELAELGNPDDVRVVFWFDN